MLQSWARQGYPEVAHFAERLGQRVGRAQQGCYEVGRCREILRLDSAGRETLAQQDTLGLRGFMFKVKSFWETQTLGQCRDLLRLGNAAILCGWAAGMLCGHSAVEKDRNILWLGTAGIFGCWAASLY